MTHRWAIVGTDTGVGKTLVTASLLAALRARGTAALALKPVESGSIGHQGQRLGEDGLLFARTAGVEAALTGLYRLKAPLSPSLAARLEGVSIEIPTLCAWVQALELPGSPLLVEGVGGLMSPLNDSETGLDLLLALKPTHTFLVSRNRLGTLSQVLVHARVLQQAGISVTAAILTPGEMPVQGQPAKSDSGFVSAEASNLEELRRFFPRVLLCEPIHPVTQQALLHAGACLLTGLQQLTPPLLT